MAQKIIQIGNSTGIIIPKSILDVVSLKAGSDVELEVDETTKSLIIQNKAAKVKHSSISPHFLTILEKVNNQYGAALRKLAQK